MREQDDDRRTPVLILIADVLESLWFSLALVGFGIAYLVLGRTPGRIIGGILIVIGVAQLARVIRR